MKKNKTEVLYAVLPSPGATRVIFNKSTENDSHIVPCYYGELNHKPDSTCFCAPVPIEVDLRTGETIWHHKRPS